MKLSKQCQVIYNILLDGEWHCPAEWHFADGHCKRITDLNRELAPLCLRIESRLCNCGKHTSKVLMRRLTGQIHESPIVREFRQELQSRYKVEETNNQLQLL